jgi:PAS domain S-box-containing protein
MYRYVHDGARADMAFLDSHRKETIHLWLAIGIIVALTLLRVVTVCVAPLSTGHVWWLAPLPLWLYISMSIFVVILLWMAYRRWTDTILRRKELEFVVRGIGPDLIMVIGRDRTITMCNDAIEPIFGYSAREVLGQKTDLLYFDRRITGKRHEIYDQISNIGFHTGFGKGKRKDGRIIPLEIVTGELPHQPGAVILVRDITERKQAEDQLIAAKERAEQAHAEIREMERMRDSLTHMIVHDLKSPLTAISGYIDLVLRYSNEKLDEKETRFLKESSRLTQRLADMIGSLLDMRRIESKEMPLDPQICDLLALALDAMKIVGPDGENKQIEITLPENPTPGFCDGPIIRRVIMNLLSNAIKFTPVKGHITLTMVPHDGDVRVSVTDTGPGIPPEFHESIFDMYAQVDVREFSSGIGLTFCKLAVEAHGGTMGVESAVGAGSTLWFQVPATPASPQDAVVSG